VPEVTQREGKPPRESLISIAKIAGQHFGVTDTIDTLQEQAGSLIVELGKFRRWNFENKIGVLDALSKLSVQMIVLQSMLDPTNTDFTEYVQSYLRELKQIIRDERAELDNQRPRNIGDGKLEGASKKDYQAY